jgi:hypothetical protein
LECSEVIQSWLLFNRGTPELSALASVTRGEEMAAFLVGLLVIIIILGSLSGGKKSFGEVIGEGCGNLF